MASLSSESNTRRLDNLAHVGTDGSFEATRFLQPAAGRILTGVGLAGGQHQSRHHGSVARRILMGQQILKIVGKNARPA